MVNHDGEPSINQLVGNDDIHDLLSSNLVASGYTGRDTDKFLVDGRPDLLIRYSPDMEDIHEVHSALESMRRMQAFGVHMPLFAPVQHEGNVYIVTEHVNGMNLANNVTAQTPKRTLHDIDRTYAGVTRHLTSSVVERLTTVDDVYAPDQYMIGHTKSHPRSDVLLVDFPIVTEKIPEAPFTLELPMRMMKLARYVIDMELQSGQEMSRARQAIEVGLSVAENPAFSSDSSEAAHLYRLDKQGYIDVAHHILENQAQIDIDALDYLE